MDNGLTNTATVIRMMEKAGALLRGHFVLPSGQHTSEWVNRGEFWVHPVMTRHLSWLLTELLDAEAKGVGVVVGPGMGGALLSHWMSYHLNLETALKRKKEVLAVSLEKHGGDGFVFDLRYAEFLGGERVVVAKDILTTGGSMHLVIGAVRGAGAEVAAVACVLNRGVTAQDLEVSALVSLIDDELPSWTVDECMQPGHPCCEGVLIDTDFGNGKRFLETPVPGW